MMKPLKIGITGVRGIVGETFTPEVAVGFSQAFGTYLDSGRILVCRDTRASGPMVRAAVMAGLLAAGCEVIDLGVCPTPSLQSAVTGLKAEGGIAITAGHNPSQWNALKFVRGDGLYLNPTEAEELLDIFHQGEFAKATWNEIERAIQHQDPIEQHLAMLNNAFDVEAIKGRRLKVAVDCCNGAFGIVTDLAEPLSEELTLAVATHIRFQQKAGTVVTNVSTTSAIDEIVARYSGVVVRTSVGQAYISEAMSEHGAILGGEGSGGVTVPEVHLTHDSAAAVGLILEGLARSGQRISEIVRQLPKLIMLKRNVPVEPNRLYSVLQNFRSAIDREQLDYDLTDGIKVVLPEGWIHVRASNTESMIRVIVEANEAKSAHNLLDWTRDRLKK